MDRRRQGPSYSLSAPLASSGLSNMTRPDFAVGRPTRPIDPNSTSAARMADSFGAAPFPQVTLSVRSARIDLAHASLSAFLRRSRAPGDPSNAAPSSLRASSLSSVAAAGDEGIVLLAGGDDGVVRYWDRRSPGEAPAALCAFAASVAALSVVGTRYAAGSDDGTAAVGAFGGGAPSVVRGDHADYCRAVCLLDDETLVTGGWDRRVVRRDLKAKAAANPRREDLKAKAAVNPRLAAAMQMFAR